MKVVTAQEMQNVDRLTISETGIPAGVLMGFAGRSVADFILQNLSGLSRVAVISGTGNNGGDGFVIAYFLANAGIRTDIFIAGEESKVSETSRPYLKVCSSSGIPVKSILNDNDIGDLKKYDLIIDALLGTGFMGHVRGIAAPIIAAINRSGVKVLSVDVPSGLPSDGEAPEGEAVRASYTVTIGLPKISLVTYPGKEYTGELQIVDIGFPQKYTHTADLHVELLDDAYVKTHLSVVKGSDAHKGSIGHLLLIGGFDSMEGAIMMSARAAFEMGVGLATLLTTSRARDIIAGSIPELITRSIRASETVDFEEKEKEPYCDAISKELSAFFSEGRRYDAVIIGPGMGRGLFASMMFKVLADNMGAYGIKKALIDGDGLFHLSEYQKHKMLGADISLIITPHFHEASRLFSRTVEEVKRNRIDAALALSKKTAGVALLKGPSTIISNGTDSLINTTGNPSLATAGSGDVLSGIIGALLLKDMPSIDAAGIGAYIHGLAADLYVQESRVGILKATDIIKYIRKAVLKISDQTI